MKKVLIWFWRRTIELVIDLVNYLAAPFIELYEMIQNEE